MIYDLLIVFSFFMTAPLEMVALTTSCIYLRGYIFQKLLLACKFSCINKNDFFVKEMDTFGHIVV